MYSHLKEIEPGLELEKPVATRSRIGVLGKEGSSGGWAHLHYGIKRRQPAGYSSITHAYRAPGHYVARVERDNAAGLRAVAHVHVVVESNT